jgi:hypothetical protein
MGMRTLLPAFALLIPVLVFTGCETTHAVSGRSLVALDGFEADGEAKNAERTLETSEDGPVTFTRDARLILARPGTHWGASFQHIRVDGLRFLGVTTEGRQVSVDLRDLPSAAVAVSSPWKTALAVTIPLLVLGGLVASGVAVANMFHGFPPGRPY